MRIFAKALAACLALFTGLPATQAATIEVSSTTLLNVGQQTRGGLPNQEPNLDTVAPAFEIVSLSARDIANPVADDLSIVVSTWAAYELADRRWDNGTSSDLSGDVVTGHVSGRLFDRRLTLRLGREHVVTGVARMVQIDGGEAIVVIPGGVRLSAYGGVPVSQRFASRSGVRSWNPVGGDVAYGARLAWSLPVPGIAGRGLDLGASANFVQDDGDAVREEIGADLRLRPVADVTVAGFGAYSLYDERFSEANVRLGWFATRKLHLEADWRFVAPDLLLARNSILAVFASDSERNAYGGGATYELGRNVSIGGTYHLQVEPGETSGDDDHLGHEAGARLDWERGPTRAGAEVTYLDSLENGYVAGRIFGRREFGRLFGALDVIAHFFREQVNGEDLAVTGVLTAGIELARGFSAALSGRAGVTPYLEQSFEIMTKLAYNQTYRTREVR
jgi:hypothetical protein